MNKSEAIRILKGRLPNVMLGSHNTHWSNLVEYGSEVGWWLNVPFHKFSKDLFLVLNNAPKNCFYCLHIPANELRDPEGKFRDKQDTADIFMPSSGQKRMIDMQSGSSKVNFNSYQIFEINY